MKTVIEILNQSMPLPRGFHLHIENAPYMPLDIEGIGSGPRGQRAISVAHYYSQNGDAMRDPEMCFEVGIDEAGQIVELYPYSYICDGLGLAQESVEEDGTDRDGKPVFHTDTAMLRQQIAFALQWDRNLAEQGFLTAFHADPLTESFTVEEGSACAPVK